MQENQLYKQIKNAFSFLIIISMVLTLASCGGTYRAYRKTVDRPLPENQIACLTRGRFIFIAEFDGKSVMNPGRIECLPGYHDVKFSLSTREYESVPNYVTLKFNAEEGRTYKLISNFTLHGKSRPLNIFYRRKATWNPEIIDITEEQKALEKETDK